MSNTSTPRPTSGYSSPAPSTPTPSTKSNSSKPKAANVFSNDGSFLERFQRSKKEEEEKKKAEDDLARKRNFDNRFKQRGKRPLPDSSTTAPAESPAKRTRSDRPLTEYEKEVNSYGRSLKDSGIGVRPLVK